MRDTILKALLKQLSYISWSISAKKSRGLALNTTIVHRVAPIFRIAKVLELSLLVLFVNFHMGIGAEHL